MTITSVDSAFGHRFIGTDCDEHESCLTCGAMFTLVEVEPGHGQYVASNGDDPVDCTGDTSAVHGYGGERHCDSHDEFVTDRDEPCEHMHDCNCLFCN